MRPQLKKLLKKQKSKIIMDREKQKQSLTCLRCFFLTEMEIHMLGIGCDLADVERIEKAIARKGFKERVFTPEEITYCTGPHGDKAQSYAARFAAKEAFLKAIGTGLRGEGKLTEIAVINDELGKPELHVTGYYAAYIEKLGVKIIHLTLSHTATTAMAVVVLE